MSHPQLPHSAWRRSAAGAPLDVGSPRNVLVFVEGRSACAVIKRAFAKHPVAWRGAVDFVPTTGKVANVVMDDHPTPLHRQMRAAREALVERTREPRALWDHIILAMDADSDGAHIAVLALALLSHVFPGAEREPHLFHTLPTVCGSVGTEKFLYPEQLAMTCGERALAARSTHLLKGLASNTQSALEALLIAGASSFVYIAPDQEPASLQNTFTVALSRVRSAELVAARRDFLSRGVRLAELPQPGTRVCASDFVSISYRRFACTSVKRTVPSETDGLIPSWRAVLAAMLVLHRRGDHSAAQGVVASAVPNVVRTEVGWHCTDRMVSEAIKGLQLSLALKKCPLLEWVDTHDAPAQPLPVPPPAAGVGDAENQDPALVTVDNLVAALEDVRVSAKAPRAPKRAATAAAARDRAAVIAARYRLLVLNERFANALFPAAQPLWREGHDTTELLAVVCPGCLFLRRALGAGEKIVCFPVHPLVLVHLTRALVQSDGAATLARPVPFFGDSSIELRDDLVSRSSELSVVAPDLKTGAASDRRIRLDSALHTYVAANNVSAGSDAYVYPPLVRARDGVLHEIRAHYNARRAALERVYTEQRDAYDFERAQVRLRAGFAKAVRDPIGGGLHMAALFRDAGSRREAIAALMRMGAPGQDDDEKFDVSAAVFDRLAATTNTAFMSPDAPSLEASVPPISVRDQWLADLDVLEAFFVEHLGLGAGEQAHDLVHRWSDWAAKAAAVTPEQAAVAGAKNRMAILLARRALRERADAGMSSDSGSEDGEDEPEADEE